MYDIIPNQENGKIDEFFPQSRYDNKKGLNLHTYGKGAFCKFKIPKDYRKEGVYLIFVDEMEHIYQSRRSQAVVWENAENQNGN